MINNPYGQFSVDGKEFIITEPDIPRNWYNYFFTDHYITFTSQVGTGEGFLQDEKGKRLKLVMKRAMYVSDGTDFWCANALPVESVDENYQCTHGLGYTKIKTSHNGIDSTYGMFVPNETDPYIGGEIYWLTLKNTSAEAKTLKAVCYVDPGTAGTYTLQGYSPYAVHYSPALNGISYPKKIKWNGDNLSFISFLSCSQPVSGYDCAHNAFIGTYGDPAHPKAMMRNKGCTNSDCINERLCFALQSDVLLEPGEEKRVVFVCGIAGSEEKVSDFCNRFATESAFDAELDAMHSRISKILQGTHMTSPDPEMNFLVNYWLKYLTNMGSRWARVRHNGYRDIVSDTECLAAFDPKLAWSRFKRILSYQYSNGFAPRTFIDGAIKDNNFADCTVWLTFTAYTIIMELGDLSLLDQSVKFNDGTEASVYEHLKRSVDFLYHFQGDHGLIRIWGGDWNDSIGRAGLEGNGVSIWLTMAWYRACRQLIELATLKEQHEDAEHFSALAEDMKKKVNVYGWDEEGYYIYGYNDKGEKIGAHESREGNIHLNPQVWSVLSGIGENDRALTAFDSAEKRLRFPVGCSVLHPPYTKYDDGLGEITTKAPGTLENGGVYLHTIAWKIAVDAMLGRRDLVEKDMITMLPFRNPVVANRAEPYILCNSYCAAESGYRHGTPGQSWRTASGQWFLKSVYQFVFGLHPRMEGLMIDPCLPLGWRECKIVRPFRQAIYQISYCTAEGKKGIEVNGTALEGKILPYKKGKIFRVTVYI